MSPKPLVALIAAFTVAACAFTPHEVAVTGGATVEPSTIGAGRTIQLQVIDDRDSLVVGQRGVGMQGADITAGNVLETLERELIAGFEAKGFRVTTTDIDADADVEARLRAFKFFIESGFWVGAENTSVVVAIEAKRAGRDYDRTYRSSSEVAAMVVPAGTEIDAKLNAAFADVLGQIMADEALLGFLAGGGAAPSG